MSGPVAPPRLTVILDGRPRDLALREPETQEVAPLVMDPDLRSPTLVRSRRVREVLALVDTMDGTRLPESEAKAIVGSPTALAALLNARDGFYDRLVEQGRVAPECPHCGEPGGELDLLFYWVALRLPAWRLSDKAGLPGLPSLASDLPAGSRPAAPPGVQRLRIRYGEAVEGTLRCILGPDIAREEEHEWRRWAPEGSEPDDERPHWRRGSIGFRAILRLSLALRWPGGEAATPAAVDALPAGAFFFLDLLHFAASNVDVTQPDRLRMTCTSCGGAFLPVFARRRCREGRSDLKPPSEAH